jgi:hypothetical protein
MFHRFYDFQKTFMFRLMGSKLSLLVYSLLTARIVHNLKGSTQGLDLIIGKATVWYYFSKQPLVVTINGVLFCSLSPLGVSKIFVKHCHNELFFYQSLIPAVCALHKFQWTRRFMLD